MIYRWKSYEAVLYMKFTRNSADEFMSYIFTSLNYYLKSKKCAFGSYLQIFVLHEIKSIVAVLLMIILEHDY